ncbi:MAG: FeoA family protein [Methanotrichaceae archaeon]|nr:FeoA family protein [Methanotrichaceae archaeon]
MQEASEMGLIALTKAPFNQPLEIKSVSGGFSWEKKFESLGIRKGRRMRKIACQPFGGPVVVEVDGSKISLGRGIASKIEVEVVKSSSGKN